MPVGTLAPLAGFVVVDGVDVPCVAAGFFDKNRVGHRKLLTINKKGGKTNEKSGINGSYIISRRPTSSETVNGDSLIWIKNQLKPRTNVSFGRRLFLQVVNRDFKLTGSRNCSSEPRVKRQENAELFQTLLTRIYNFILAV